MTKSPLHCPHCGEINWDLAPALFRTFQFIAARAETVNADVRAARTPDPALPTGDPQ